MTSRESWAFRWTDFPLIFWMIGLAEFLAYVLVLGPTSQPSAAAWAVSATAFVALCYRDRARIIEAFRVRSDDRLATFGFLALALIVMAMLGLAGFESFKPPHLPQEYDAIMYHMGIPRQHLFAGNLKFLDWSVADLYPMSIQWGLAPYWFSLTWIQKVPQFVFALGCLSTLLSLGRRFAGPGLRAFVPAIAFVVSHGVMIQLGTAMMDLANLYFLLAAVDAFCSRRYAIGGVALGVFLSAKAFYPIQGALIGGALLGFAFLRDREALEARKKGIVQFATLAIVVASALLARSAWIDLQRTGTPFFPIATCVWKAAPGCQGLAGELIRESSQHIHAAVSTTYGNGKGPLAFVRHLWRVAVPTQGVNNEFDYPLGLPWLLLLPFIALTLGSARSRELPFPYILALGLLFWAFWWVSSQQARWLYPTLALGWLGTLEAQRRTHLRVIFACLLASGLLSFASEWRALKASLTTPAAQLQRSHEEVVVWDSVKDQLISKEILYVNRLVVDHAPESRAWILR